MKKFIMLGVFSICLLAFKSHAATGDILAADLHDTSSVSSLRTRTIQTQGCAPGGTGACVKMNCANGTCSGSDAWDLGIPPTKEITIVWWERYSVWPLNAPGATQIANCKSIRPYHGSTSSTISQNYTAALITAYEESVGNNAIYMSAWDGNAKLIPSKYVTKVDTSSDACTQINSDGTYGCPQGRMLFKWSTDGGITDGMGTQWRKMRMHILMPDSFTSANGVVNLWIDDKLIYTMTNLDMKDTGVPQTTSVRFAPVDETPVPHEHWYDEITIYEGYVPPEHSIKAPSNAKGTVVR